MKIDCQSNLNHAEFDIITSNIDEGGRVFIHTYESSDNTKITLAIDFTENTVQLFEALRDRTIDELTEATSIEVNQGEWFNVRITVQDQRIRVFLNDKQKLSSSIDSTNAKGRVRFRSPNPSILFDNIRIWTLEDVFVPTDTPTPRPPTPLPTPIPLGNILASEDFDDGSIADWEDESNAWKISYSGINPVYHRAEGSTGWAIFEVGEEGWQEYALEFDISTSNIDGGGRVFIHTVT